MSITSFKAIKIRPVTSTKADKVMPCLGKIIFNDFFHFGHFNH